MRIADVAAAVQVVAPAELAASWDNTGLLFGDPGEKLKGVLLTIDLTPEVIAEATMRGCNAVVAYHPPLFKPVSRFAPRDLAFLAMRAGLAVVSPHTSLDVVTGGTNDHLARILGLAAVVPLASLRGGALPAPQSSQSQGLGRVGSVVPLTADELAERLKRGLGLSSLLIVGDRKRTVTRVAVCAGSGGSLLQAAASAEADCFVTGELSHHDALSVLRNGMVALCTFHSNAERMVLPWLRDLLSVHLPGVLLHISDRDRDPFSIL